MWNSGQACCDPSLVISSACGSLQMCNFISIVQYHFFFFKLSYVSLTLIPFSEELNIKSIISNDLNKQFSFHVLAVLVGTQSIGAWS